MVRPNSRSRNVRGAVGPVSDVAIGSLSQFARFRVDLKNAVVVGVLDVRVAAQPVAAEALSLRTTRCMSLTSRFTT
jgi:hypothetical protein